MDLFIFMSVLMILYYCIEHVIYKIFSSEEEAELTTQGIHIPELPPELNPHGYYGC